MANGALGGFADLSRYQRAVAQPFVSPLDSAIQGFTQGQAIVNLPQTIQENALNAQLQQAIAMQKIQQLQTGSIENVGGRLVRVNPNTGKVEVILEASNPTNFQLVGFDPTGRGVSYDTRNNAFTNPSGGLLTGPLTPKTLAPETFSTVVADQGLQRVGSRSTQGVPMLLQSGEQATAPVKDVKLDKLTNSQGWVMERPITGGAYTLSLDDQGNPINLGVPNQIITSDQGLVRVPTKTSGQATAVTISGDQGPIPLTKTSGKSNAGPSISSAYQEEASIRNLQSIGDLKTRVGPFTTGVGSLLSKLPGTDATDFAADLETLKANIAFGELAAMRAASKTGGALGSVSNKETKLLESSLGALDTSQSSANFLKNLNNIEASINRWKAAAAKAPTMGPSAGTNESSPTPSSIRQKYGF